MSTLDNGVRVITEVMPHVRSVSVGIWIGSGSRRESTEQNGISHFIEHMLFKGTTSRSAEDIARSVDALGGNLDAFTAKELVCFNTKVLDQHLSLAFDVLADLVLHPMFREEDIEKEKGVILEEIKMEEDSPDYLVHEIFSANFWKDHALGKPILGTPQSVRRFDSTMVRDFYNAVYAPANVLVTAAGNLTHEGLTTLVRQHFDSLPKGDAAPAEQAPSTHARIALRNKKSLEQVHLCLGVPSYPLPHQERFACYVLNTLAGRRHEFAPVPEYPRAAGAGLFRIQRIKPVPRHGLPVDLCRDQRGIGAKSGGIHHQGISRTQRTAGER